MVSRWLSTSTLTVLFWIAGLILVGALVFAADVEELSTAIVMIGWGLAPVLMIRVVLLGVDGHSWRCLFPRADRPGLRAAAFQRWIGESVSTMLPFAAIGGELARVRVITLNGVAGAPAFASIIADGVVALISQLFFLGIGIALFASEAVGEGSLDHAIVVGTSTLLIAVVAIWNGLRKNLIGRLAKVLKTDLAGERVVWLADAMASVDRHIERIVTDMHALGLAASWRLLGWILGTTEVWLILSLIEHPITLSQALVLDAVTSAVRTAFFFVPGGLVVQEGALISVGAALGLNGEAILIAAVVKRGREIFFSIPGMLAWNRIESRRLYNDNGPHDSKTK